MIAKALDQEKTEEGRTAAMKACRYIAEHDLLKVVPIPTAASVVEVVDKGRGLVDEVKRAASDPDVQKVASSLGDVLSGIGSILKASKRKT